MGRLYRVPVSESELKLLEHTRLRQANGWPGTGMATFTINSNRKQSYPSHTLSTHTWKENKACS